MSFWFLLQILINLILLSGVVGLWIRMNRPPKDDPRLSKGLQLLQSKIAVLEDLSDRTETQVKQLTALLEQKVKDIQVKIQASEKQISKIDQSMQKSLEVAKIFQDRIPHTEILERQNTIKYVKAARLAHQGLSVDEICQQVALSHGEVEFIAKVNRDQLMFCEESLPEWVQEDSLEAGAEPEIETEIHHPLEDFSNTFEVPQSDQEALKKLGDAFKAACQEAKDKEEAAIQTTQNVSALFNMTQNIAQNFLSPKPEAEVRVKSEKPETLREEKIQDKKMDNVIRPVEFRRIDMSRDLR